MMLIIFHYKKMSLTGLHIFLVPVMCLITGSTETLILLWIEFKNWIIVQIAIKRNTNKWTSIQTLNIVFAFVESVLDHLRLVIFVVCLF